MRGVFLLAYLALLATLARDASGFVASRPAASAPPQQQQRTGVVAHRRARHHRARAAAATAAAPTTTMRLGGASSLVGGIGQIGIGGALGVLWSEATVATTGCGPADLPDALEVVRDRD